MAPLLLLGLLVTVSGCGSPSPAGTRTTFTYCGRPGAGETLEVYSPSPAPSRSVPLVMWLHGGAWILGDDRLEPRTLIGDVESAIVGRGWLFATVDYGLAPRDKWPAQIADAMCAVRYLRAHAAALHADPAHFGVIGASAGGQLASLLGLAGPAAGFDTGPHLDESSAVQAVVDEYGPTDLNAPSWSSTPLARQVSPEVFGVPAQPPSAVLAGASPVNYVTRDAPPFLVVQGADDDIVAPQQSRLLVDRLRAVGASATLLMVEHAGHGLVRDGRQPLDPPLSAVAQQTEQFLVTHLG